MEEGSEDNGENRGDTGEKEKIEGESEERPLVETNDGITQIAAVEGESASACPSKTDNDGSSPFKSPMLAFKLPAAMSKTSPKSVIEFKEKPMKGGEITKDNAGEEKKSEGGEEEKKSEGGGGGGEEKKREGSGGGGVAAEKSAAGPKRKPIIAAALTPAQKVNVCSSNDVISIIVIVDSYK